MFNKNLAKKQHKILDVLDYVDVREDVTELIKELGDFGVPETTYVLHRTFEIGKWFPQLTAYLSGGEYHLLGMPSRLTLLGELESKKTCIT